MTNANLQVQPGQNPSPDWIKTQAQNSTLWYSYQYTGGTDGHGGMEVTVGQGSQTLNVALDTDNRRYTISDVTLGDPQQQLRISGARSGNNITIIDKNDTVELNGYYGLYVTDGNANNVVVYCDPMIKNEPQNPPQARMRHKQAQ